MNDKSACFNLLVLFSSDIERLRSFYEKLLDLQFVREQHDQGPPHYSCKLGEVIFEIYPQKERGEKSTASCGFLVSNLEDTIKLVGEDYIHCAPSACEYGKRAILCDPDKNLVHLLEKKELATH